MKKAIIFMSTLAFLMALQAQSITVTDALGQSPETFVRNHLMGDGVYVFNVKYNNASSTITAPSIGTFAVNNWTGFEIQNGIVMTTGNIDIVPGPQQGEGEHELDPYYSDLMMSRYASEVIYGSSTLDFDFISLADTFSINYCFASNEYPYNVCTQYDDWVGFFLTGPDPATGIEVTKNLAIVPGTVSNSLPDGIPVSVNTINNGQAGMLAYTFGFGTNCHYEFTGHFVDNHILIYDTINGVAVPIGVDTTIASCRAMGFRGFTRKLSAEGSVIPCQVYHMHISVCNIKNNGNDSGVLIEGGSFNAPSVEIGINRTTIDTISGRCGLSIPLSLAQTGDFDNGTVHFAFGGDASYGSDFEIVDEFGQTINNMSIDNEVHSFVLRALPGADLSEPKTIEVYLATSLCPQYPELMTHDTMRFVLVGGTGVELRDTTITCSQACFELSAPLVSGEEPITYRWEPTTGLADPYSRTTAAAIFESTDYMLIATGGSGCYSDTATVHVVITGTNPDEPPLGINEWRVQNGECKVWPNPAGDVIHIAAEGLRNVELYSLDGRKLGTWSATANGLDLPTDGLANGTYGLRIVTDAGATGSKIVVNK